MWSIQTDYYLDDYDLVKMFCIEGIRITMVLARMGTEESG